MYARMRYVFERHLIVMVKEGRGAFYPSFWGTRLERLIQPPNSKPEQPLICMSQS